MKKISILLILVMIISLFPALSVSAADGDYFLKGIYQDATIVIQHEAERTVTLVDAANEIHYLTTATNVAKVVYTFNDAEPVTVSASPFSYKMVFDHTGVQTLTYDVYKTSGDGVTPDQSKTITFNVIAGTNNSASFTENFNSIPSDITQENLQKVAGNYSNYIVASNTNGTLGLKSTTGWKVYTFKGAAPDTGSKVHYYEFDLPSSGYGPAFRVNGTDLFNIGNDPTTGVKDNGKYLSNLKPRVTIAIDYTLAKPIATVLLNGNVWRQVEVTKNDTIVSFGAYVHPTYGVTIDNLNYTVYDAKGAQSFTGASIVGGKNKPVLETLSGISFTGLDYLLEDGADVTSCVTITERANDSEGDFAASSIDFTATLNGADVDLAFADELSTGTTYKVAISGIQDGFYNYYNDYEFTFRTLNEGENPLPEIALTSPEADARYYPNEDTITLSADAYDTLGGSITKVEFFADGELIGEGVLTEGNAESGTYTYEWVLDDSIDRSEPVAITAVATDNSGDTSETMPVNVVIWSRQLPEITITSPEQGQVYCSNLAGMNMEVKPKIEFVAADADGTIESIVVYVDGEAGITLDDASAVSYTLLESLEAGEHKIIVEVYDNDGQSARDSISIIVEDQGKAGYLFNENYADKDLFAKWSKSGNATFTYGSLTDYEAITGIIISGAEGTANHAIVRNFADVSFATDVKMAFNDTTTNRTVKLGSAVLVTFNSDGTYDGSEVTDLAYSAGEIYNISAVVDAKNKKVYALVNGTYVGAIDATYTVNPKITITHGGAGETAILSANASLIGEAVAPIVMVDGNKITVDFPAGVDESSLEGNVSVVNAETGKAVSLIYANGVFTINEVLKYDTAYNVIVLPDVRDVNGFGYSGSYIDSFVTDEPDEVGVADIAVAEPVLAEGNFTATIAVVFNGAEETKTVYLVCAAYNGAKMEDYQVIELTAPARASDIDLALSGVSETATIEAFVVDSLDDINSVSDKIFVIR